MTAMTQNQKDLLAKIVAGPNDSTAQWYITHPKYSVTGNSLVRRGLVEQNPKHRRGFRPVGGYALEVAV
jgi:hypothetical protein